MLTTNMTNRQMAEFYYGLEERAEKLFNVASNRMESTISNNPNTVSSIIEACADGLKKMEPSSLYKVETVIILEEEVSLIKRIVSDKNLKAQAFRLLGRFLQKRQKFAELAAYDEDNN